MTFKFGDSVITSDNRIGIVIQVHEFTRQYFVSFPSGGRLYNENEITSWHGC